MMPNTVESPVATELLSQHVVVQTRPVALQKRRWRSSSLIRKDMVCILVVRYGRALLADTQGQQQLTAPAALLIPAQQSLMIDIEAGCECLCIGISSALINESIGARAESIKLSRIADRLVFCHSLSVDVLTQLETLIMWSENELADTRKQSWMCVTAYARLLLLCIHRSASESTQVMIDDKLVPDSIQHFRHLVELHYREHWSTSAYAHAMGMTYDRLHRLCKRELNNTPLRLLQQRLVNEAQRQLEHSGLSIQEIGAHLGFPDAPTFSHFFKRMVGDTPGRYRQATVEKMSVTHEDNQPGFADWP